VCDSRTEQRHHGNTFSGIASLYPVSVGASITLTAVATIENTDRVLSTTRFL